MKKLMKMKIKMKKILECHFSVDDANYAESLKPNAQ